MRCIYSVLSGILVVSTLLPYNSHSQNISQLSLPDGAIARLGNGRITGSAVYSPNGERLAVSSSIGVWLYDARTGNEIDLLMRHTAPVSSLSYSRDGRTLASASYDETICLWNGRTGEHRLTIKTGHRDGVTAVAVSPDASIIASAGRDGAVHLWNARTGTVVHTFTAHNEAVWTVAYSMDGHTLASGGRDTIIRLWDTRGKQPLGSLEGHKDSVYSVAFSSDGRTLASGSADGIVGVWDLPTRERRFPLHGPSAGGAVVAISRDGKLLASGGNSGAIEVWDLATGIRRHKLSGHRGKIRGVAFSPDRTRIVSAASGRDQTIILWDVHAGKNIKTLENHTAGVASVTFSLEGDIIASGSYDNRVHLWDARTWRPLQRYEGHSDTVDSVTYSPDGFTLASGSRDGTIRLWDLRSGEYRQLSTPGALVSSIAFSRDGVRLASGHWDASIRVWELRADQLPRLYLGHTDFVTAVAFSVDGLTLASGSRDETIRLWDIARGRQKEILLGHSSGVESVAYSPDGTKIASAGGEPEAQGRGGLRLWDSNTGDHIRTFIRHENLAFTVAFSPDGKRLASGGGWTDNRVRLWNSETAEPQEAFDGHTNIVNSVAFSSNGRILASGSDDGTILLWNTSLNTRAIVEILPAKLTSPAVGSQLILEVGIVGGAGVAGYQCTVGFDSTALRYVEQYNAVYLPGTLFEIPPVVTKNSVTIAAASLVGENSGDGTLATLVFEVVAEKESHLTLSGVELSDITGFSSKPRVRNGKIIVRPSPKGDVNGDGVVNIQDLVIVATRFGQPGEEGADVNGDGVVNIQDLVLVAAAFATAAAAPSESLDLREKVTAAEIRSWLSQAERLDSSDATLNRGVVVLKRLLVELTERSYIPTETSLLPNFPNPFNPETWIPYQMAEPLEVTITIYNGNGLRIRELAAGHRPAGLYRSRSRAAYWDGRNQLGEPVASGVYFYTLTAGNFAATRKMQVNK